MVRQSPEADKNKPAAQESAKEAHGKAIGEVLKSVGPPAGQSGKSIANNKWDGDESKAPKPKILDDEGRPIPTKRQGQSKFMNNTWGDEPKIPNPEVLDDKGRPVPAKRQGQSKFMNNTWGDEPKIPNLQVLDDEGRPVSAKRQGQSKFMNNTWGDEPKIPNPEVLDDEGRPVPIANQGRVGNRSVERPIAAKGVNDGNIGGPPDLEAAIVRRYEQKQAKELASVIDGAIGKDDNAYKVAEAQIQKAFRQSLDPRGLADELAGRLAEKGIKVGYHHGIDFYSFQSFKDGGGGTGGWGSLCSYDGQIPKGKGLGVTNDQIKPLANAVRAITSRDGEFTQLEMAERQNNNPALLQQARFVKNALANTGRPQALVADLSKEIAAADKAEGLGNHREINYRHVLSISKDVPPPASLDAQKAAKFKANPGGGFAILDAGKSYNFTIDLSK